MRRHAHLACWIATIAAVMGGTPRDARAAERLSRAGGSEGGSRQVRRTAPCDQGQQACGARSQRRADAAPDALATRPPAATLAYFGETLLHPGALVGGELAISKHLSVNYALGGYVHARHHTALLLVPGLQTRWTTTLGYTCSLGLGLGYIHSWPHGGPVFRVDASGQVLRHSSAGQAALMPHVSLGLLGWDLRQRLRRPIRLQGDLMLFGQFPYNGFMMPHVASIFGVTYFLESSRSSP